MLTVRGRAGETELTGTIYERGEDAPTFRGAPDQDTAYVWICDEFYEVDSGGARMELDGRVLNVAFESPLPRGFDTKERAIAAAKDHVRTQFLRIGVASENVDVSIEPGEEARERIH